MRIDPNTGAMTLGVAAFGLAREPISAAIAAIGSTIAGATTAAGAPLVLASAAPAAASAGSLASTALTASSVLGAVGTGISALSSLQAGKQAQADANFLAIQQEQKANEERAIGQQKMFKERRQAELVQSRLRAVAAAGGGDTTDTGVVNLGGDIAEEGEFQALNEFWRGENAARGYKDMAAATRARGASLAAAAPIKAIGTILEGGSSMFAKYADPRLSPYR